MHLILVNPDSPEMVRDGVLVFGIYWDDHPDPPEVIGDGALVFGIY